MASGGSKKVIIISLCANFGIAIAKLVGSIFTGSAALLAEAVHSFSDCGNQLLLLYGGYAAKKPPTIQHPLGRGKEIFFWSFVVALLLFTMGGMFSLYEGVHKIMHPEPLKNPLVGIGILCFAAVLEGIAFFACLKEVKIKKRDKPLWQWIKSTTAVDLLVIFLEDFAALLGLTFALIALIIAWQTGNTVWDGIGSCAIGVLLIITAVILAKEVKSMLIGEIPAKDYRNGIEEELKKELPEASILNLITLQQGVDSVLVACKIHPGETKQDLHEAIDRLNRFEAAVKQRFPVITWQFIEFDVED